MAGPVSITDEPPGRLPELMAVNDLARSAATSSDEAVVANPTPYPPAPVPTAMPPAAVSGGRAPPMPPVPGLAEAPGMPPGGAVAQPGMPPGGTAAAQVRRPMSAAEWVAVNHPELASKPRVLKSELARVNKEYQDYIATDLAVQRLGQTAARTDAITAGKRGQSAETGYRGKNDVPVPTELVDAATAALKRGDYTHPAVVQLKQFYGVAAAKSGVPGTNPQDEVEANAAAEMLAGNFEGPYLRIYRNLKVPGTMAPDSVNKIIAGLIAGGDETVKRVMGSASDPKGRSKRLGRSSVRDWLYTRNVLTSVAQLGSLTDRSSVQSMLADRAPTAEQVIAARDAVELSPEQTNELLHYVLSPAEIAAIKAKQNAPPSPPAARAPRIRPMPQ